MKTAYYVYCSCAPGKGGRYLTQDFEDAKRAAREFSQKYLPSGFGTVEIHEFQMDPDTWKLVGEFYNELKWRERKDALTETSS